MKEEDYITAQQLVDQLSAIIKRDPEYADAYVCAYPCGMREEEGLEALEEEYPQRIFFVDDDLGTSRIDLNF